MKFKKGNQYAKLSRGMKGKHHTANTRKRISKNMKGKKNAEGEKNNNWKGGNVGYFALHTWVARHKPKVKFCERCGKKRRLGLANISGKYLRDIDDFRWECYECNQKDGVSGKRFYNPTKPKKRGAYF
jgi:hypothetical protein